MDKIAILKDRALMLNAARLFFAERGILEVDCPILTSGASVDAHIDLIPAHAQDGIRYMHSSPEYGMKRLIANGIGDIYQISHVFRDGESSPKHNPEFTMAEWYRLDTSFTTFIEETLDFIRLFLGDLPSKVISYREVFQQFAGIDYLHSSTEKLVHFLDTQGIEIASSIDTNDKDTLLNIILGTIIEPQLGIDNLTVLAYYPASQAALAKTEMRQDEKVAERFEIYFQGIELANGYHELTDPIEQRRRFIQANEERDKLGKNTLPIDEHFIAALIRGLPDCCGVAVGFDRLMMLRHSGSTIGDVIPFAWPAA